MRGQFSGKEMKKAKKRHKRNFNLTSNHKSENNIIHFHLSKKFDFFYIFHQRGLWKDSFI